MDNFNEIVTHNPALQAVFIYLQVSLLTLLAYAWDKRQARLGRWRVPERRLHLLELFGGWPGALLAQRWLRHKSRKRSYQVCFWAIVLLHLGGWGLWLFEPSWSPLG